MKFRLYPTVEQEQLLLQHCSSARLIWNLALEQSNYYSRRRGPAPNCNLAAAQLTELRQDNLWVAAGSQTVQQQALKDLDQAFKNWWRNPGHFGRPSWRCKGRHEGFRIVGSQAGRFERLSRHRARVNVPKVGWVDFRWSQNPAGAKSYRVKRDAAGRWWIAFAMVPAPLEGPGDGSSIGIDCGVAHPFVTSEGENASAAWPAFSKPIDCRRERNHCANAVLFKLDDGAKQEKPMMSQRFSYATGALVMAVTVGVLAFAASSSAQAGTVWLCKPGIKSNPCAVSMGNTAVYSDRTTKKKTTAVPKSPPVDCFYVYPTVSNQTTGNANLRIDPEEIAVAQSQASRFQAKCKIYAPMYRQLTRSSSMLHAGTPTTPADMELPYTDVKAAWKEYLSKYNKGRGVILIGHSQGTANLTRLVKEEIDPASSVRRKLVSAMLIGGAVLVPEGKDVGGSFQHIPPCRAANQTHCVIAYNSYLTAPPANGQFGITLKPGMRVLCVNPNALAAGATGSALPYLPASRLAPVLSAAGFGAPNTQWISLPGMYSTQCKSNESHTWLQVSDIGPAGDPRPHLRQTLGPTWGLHMTDISINLGSLVSLAGKEAAAWKP